MLECNISAAALHPCGVQGAASAEGGFPGAHWCWCRAMSGIPEVFRRRLQLQVTFMTPRDIALSGEGVYPQISLKSSRVVWGQSSHSSTAGWCCTSRWGHHWCDAQEFKAADPLHLKLKDWLVFPEQLSVSPPNLYWKQMYTRYFRNGNLGERIGLHMQQCIIPYKIQYTLQHIFIICVIMNEQI